ncbi:hypothetical protein QYE76_025385 [Lolium multiflorum]|uniref:Auxin efflux carrier component n=1 Tax=Lolium multiflorum TaxID=4521 RepID=A0AAD8RE08_LOLMU|nr:hypothetical protein QYE76_025385 [Lolium multiflorum]
MISGSAVYQVLEAMAPLYTAAALGYASVRWLKAFSDEQCAGINHFVALYAVPVLIFHMVSTNDLYAMSGRLIAADTLQKLAILLGLVARMLWARSRRHRDDDGTKAAPSLQLEWVVTAFSVASLPNTIIMGVPLLRGMYGEVSTTLLKPIVVMQFCFWYNVIIFLYEYMEAMRAAATVTKEIISPPASPEKGDLMRVVIIETTDVTVASMAQGSIVVETNTTSVGKDEEAGTFGDVAKAPSVKHVLWMAVKKILRIPNTYASILGLIWSLVAFKCGIKMPKVIDDSLFTIYSTAVGLSMFSSGTFIARQSQFIPCGYTIASMSMLLKFLIGPVVMLIASLVVGMHGTLLHMAVVQAALPLAVTSFVYAEEYKVQADIMSTGVIFGIFISLPVTIVYYILLGSWWS